MAKRWLFGKSCPRVVLERVEEGLGADLHLEEVVVPRVVSPESLLAHLRVGVSVAGVDFPPGDDRQCVGGLGLPQGGVDLRLVVDALVLVVDLLLEEDLGHL